MIFNFATFRLWGTCGKGIIISQRWKALIVSLGMMRFPSMPIYFTLSAIASVLSSLLSRVREEQRKNVRPIRLGYDWNSHVAALTTMKNLKKKP